MTDMKAIEADALARFNTAFPHAYSAAGYAYHAHPLYWPLHLKTVTELHTVLDREAETQRRHDAKLAEMEAELSTLRFRAGLIETFPLGAHVRKIAGPQWDGVVVGYYSSSLTPEGLVIECTAPGALHQVHVEPAKRMEIVEADRDDQS